MELSVALISYHLKHEMLIVSQESGASSRIEEVADQDHEEHHLVQMRLIIFRIARVQIFIKYWQIIGCKQHSNGHHPSISAGIFQKFLLLMNQ